MGKYKRLGKNIVLLLTGNFVTKILSFLMVPFYTSYLSTSDYGATDLISTTVLLVLPFFTVLMDEAIMRFSLDQTNDKKQVFTIAFSVSTMGFIAVMFLSPVLLLFESLRPYYWFVVLYYVSSWLYNLCSNYVKGLDRVGVIATAGVVHTFLFLAINILGLAILNWGVYGYLLAIDLSNLLTVAYLFLYCRLYRNFTNPFQLDKNLAKDMVRYSVPMIPDYISWWINNASDRYILTMFCGTSVTGLYSVAYKIPTILNSLSSIFSSAWKISSVDNFGSEESIRFYSKIYSVYSVLLMMGSAGLILVTKLLAWLLFSNDFFKAWRITPILILAYLISAQAIFISSIFMASKKTKALFYASSAGAVVNVVLNFVLIPHFQGIGAAIATVMGYVTIFAINVLNTRAILKMDFKLVRNGAGIVCIIFEIIGIQMDNLIGYCIAGGCTLFIVVLCWKELCSLTSGVIQNIKNRGSAK